MNKRLLYYGSDTPLPERVPLRAGALSLIYENGDLRDVCLGRQVVLLRLYWAVRDQGWGTVANVISNLEMDVSSEAFHIRYDAICRDEHRGRIDHQQYRSGQPDRISEYRHRWHRDLEQLECDQSHQLSGQLDGWRGDHQ